MLHIERPVAFEPGDDDVVSRVDAFLRDHDKCSISTVANTIFPAALDRGDGIDALTGRYLEVFERRMHRTGEWGRYFQRMVAWPDSGGSGTGTVNQLAENIKALQAMRLGKAKFFGNVTEIALFDPARDLRKKMNRQCLSFIELKPQKENGVWRLSMMAVYRNHYYIQRTLGNLIGLGRLLQFIARETGFDIGSLTIQSTHACLDSDLRKGDISDLIDACRTKANA
jgi:thymidylate synthase